MGEKKIQINRNKEEIPLRINPLTIIYYRPGQNPEEVRARYQHLNEPVTKEMFKDKEASARAKNKPSYQKDF